MTDLKNIEVLLVEDNASDAELILRALGKIHLAEKVFHVKDGAQALDFIFARGAYALRREQTALKAVFLDLKLPKIDGLEVLRQIKADERARMIPVVVLTSSQEERDVIEAYRLGANSYVAKPVDFDELSKAICEVGSYWVFLNKSLVSQGL